MVKSHNLKIFGEDGVITTKDKIQAKKFLEDSEVHSTG
jgi:hypothetical protein